MARVSFSQYHRANLFQLTERLAEDYYTVIDHLCEQVNNYADCNTGIMEGSLYYSLCIRLAGEIKKQVMFRRRELLPYVQQLSSGRSKAMTAENADIQLSGKAASIKASHRKVKELVYHIHQLSTPQYVREDEKDIRYRVLRKEIALLDDVLTELFYIEEAILMPKMLEADEHITPALA